MKGNLTIGEELQIENRKRLIRAWLCDIGIVVLVFTCGTAFGYYVGHYVVKP